MEATAFAAFFHSGQICMNARKVLVERPVYETFVSRLACAAGGAAVGLTRPFLAPSSGR